MRAEVVNPKLSWNLARDVSQVLEYHFMVNALIAGSIVAVTAGLIGWLMVLRQETFAGHTLSMMAFPGAGGAALIGVPAAWGYFFACGAGALAIGRFSAGEPRSPSERSASIGSVQALALASGFLFVSLYGGVLGDLENLLFGTFLGVSDGQVLVLLLVSVGALSVLGALARPLLFASVDPAVAEARGMPVRVLSSAFLVLLVFSLLVTPAATAQAITARPALGLVLTVALGLLVVWLGLGIAYFSVYPAGFFITTISFAIYVLVRVLVARRAGRPGDRVAAAPPVPRRGVIA